MEKNGWHVKFIKKDLFLMNASFIKKVFLFDRNISEKNEKNK